MHDEMFLHGIRVVPCNHVRDSEILMFEDCCLAPHDFIRMMRSFTLVRGCMVYEDEKKALMDRKLVLYPMKFSEIEINIDEDNYLQIIYESKSSIGRKPLA